VTRARRPNRPQPKEKGGWGVERGRTWGWYPLAGKVVPFLTGTDRSESLADLSLEHLPQPPPAAEGHWPGFDTASSSEVVRRYEHGLSAREKRSKRASAEKAERLFRDGLLARLWVIPNKGT
jgi:hypothetical protein